MELKYWDDCSHKEKVQRWEKVLEVLSKLTPHQQRKHFDMGSWGYKTECGTIGCAAGLCANNKWFKDRGFEMFFIKSVSDGPGVTHVGQLTVTADSFFGIEGNRIIFTNPHFVHIGYYTTRQVIYKRVIEAIKSYIQRLKQMGT